MFIQGFWRAGMTLFHELLADLRDYSAPRTRRCMEPSAMSTRAGSSSAGEAIERPMDHVIVAADCPQEDEFALMAMGCPQRL